jgi:hypothetical protein
MRKELLFAGQDEIQQRFARVKADMWERLGVNTFEELS